MQIEKNIPLPSSLRDTKNSKLRKSAAGRDRIPFQEMEVGDSVLVPLDFDGSANPHALVRVQAYRASSGGKKYISKKQPDGFRVWRIA